MSKKISLQGFWGKLKSKTGFQRLSANFFLLIMFLRIFELVKKSHIEAITFCIFLKNILKQT